MSIEFRTVIQYIEMLFLHYCVKALKVNMPNTQFGLLHGGPTGRASMMIPSDAVMQNG